MSQVERSGEFNDIHAMAEKEAASGKEFGENVDTENEYLLSRGTNLPNHSLSQMGRGAFVTPNYQAVPIFRTKQSAYRFAGWLLTMADTLPDEEGSHSFAQVLNAIKRSGR